MIRIIFALMVLPSFMQKVLANEKSNNYRSEDTAMNLWPIEDAFQPQEDILKHKIDEDIVWFYEKLYPRNEVAYEINEASIPLDEYFLFKYKNSSSGGNNVISLDTSGKKGIALLLHSSSMNGSCGDRSRGDNSRYVILPKEYSSDQRNYEVRCFQIKKCEKEINLVDQRKHNQNEQEMIKVKFDCIEDFDSQLTMLIEEDLKRVGKNLDLWSSNKQKLQKNVELRTPLQTASSSDESFENEPTIDSRDYNGNNQTNTLSTNLKQNRLRDQNENSTAKDQHKTFLNNEDLNLFDAEEIQFNTPIDIEKTNYSEQNTTIIETSSTESDKPQQRMIDEHWNPNKVSKRLPIQEELPTRKESQEVKPASTDLDIDLSTPLQSRSQEKYEKNYVEKLESSYENKFNLMIALYATTFIILIIVVAILIWYCKKQMTSIKRGVEYRTNTYNRDGFDGDLNFSKKEGSVDGGGSISTAGQISLGKLTPSTHYKRIESPSLNAVSSRNGSTTVSYGGKSIEATYPLDTLDVFADPKMGSQTSIAERTSTHSNTFPTVLPPPPKTPKMAPLRSYQQ